MDINKCDIKMSKIIQMSTNYELSRKREAPPTVIYGTLNKPAQTQLWHYLTAPISESITDKYVKFWHNLESDLEILQLKFEMDIFHSLEIMRFST